MVVEWFVIAGKRTTKVENVKIFGQKNVLKPSKNVCFDDLRRVFGLKWSVFGVCSDKRQALLSDYWTIYYLTILEDSE